MNWLKDHQTILSWLFSGFILALYLSYKDPHNNYAKSHSRTTVIQPLPARSGPTQANSFFQSNIRQTDVYLKKEIELLPENDDHLLFSPIFDVPGDQITAPHHVLLRFISIAKQRKFPYATVLDITVDGINLLQETRYDSSSFPTEEKMVMENVGTSISYDKFVQMVSGQSIIIRVGDEQTTLRTSQLEALRDMVRCVEAQQCR